MRKLLLTLALMAAPSVVAAQVTVFPATGTADPAQFSSPDGSIVFGGVVGAVTGAIDSSDIGHFSFGTATVSGDCIQGDYYIETDARLVSFCVTTNVWRTLSTLESGTADPGATCDVGQFYYETDQQDLFFCYAANAWSMIVTNTTPTDDAVLVGNGTTYQNKVLPNGLVSYNTTTNAFSLGSAAAFDPATQEDLFEDFCGGTTTNGAIGKNGMAVALTATGTFSYANSTAPADNPCLATLNSHASNDDSGAAVWFGNNATNAGSPVLFNNDWTYDAVMVAGFTGDITNVAYYFGIADATIVSNLGIYARFDSDRTDGTWIFVVCDVTGATGCQHAGDTTDQAVVASTITPVDGTRYRIRIRRVAAGVGGTLTYYFRVNDETEKTFCASDCDDVIADAPVAGHAQADQAKIVAGCFTRTTTGVVACGVDYMRFTATVDRY